MNIWDRTKYLLAGKTPPSSSRSIVSMRPRRGARSFYAGVVDRLTATLKGVPLSINESLKKDLDKMRHRSRQVIHDNDYGKKYINLHFLSITTISDFSIASLILHA